MKELFKYLYKPELYAPSTSAFWDNEHISKGMLANHLNPDNDGATRNQAFVEQSVTWIADKFPAQQYPSLLDLGCGPGIYAELFHKQGYQVTGVDFSRRSIAYAKQSAENKKLPIKYHYLDYLSMEFKECFDLVTLIWCDYGALAPKDRNTLLQKIHQALKPKGMLLLDVFSEQQLLEKQEAKTFNYYPDGGFWSAEQHLCLNSLYFYEQRVIVEQAVIVTEDTVDCFNIWEHYFAKAEIEQEITEHGFSKPEIYANLIGEKYTTQSKTICLAAQKV